MADPDSRGASPRGGLRITVTDARGRAVRAAGLVRWLQRVAPPAARGDLAIALVTDREMRTLNRHYRRIDRPTDVLSFSVRVGPHPHPHLEAEYLGDIAIATGVAARQARAEGHSSATELKILALHGLLHLLGYDHDDPADAGRMARVERRLRRKGDLGAGVIERASRASEPRERSEPAKRRARERVGETEGRSPSVKK